MSQNPIVRLDVASARFVWPLYSGMVPRQLHLEAVLRGDSEGTVYADSRERPGAACVLAGEGCYLAGRSPEASFFDEVRRLLPCDRDVAVFFGAEVAAEDLARATRNLYMVPARRRVAFLRRRPSGVRPPEGLVLRPIDSELLQRDAPGAREVREAVLHEWPTADRFLDRGFGTVAVSGDRVVAHSIADYVVADECEIGVHVDEECRRLGVGTAVAAATAQEAFARGLTTVGWHSWANNAGSIAISRRLGFADEAFYAVLFNHWAAENIADMSQEEFRSFAEEYERRFAQCPPAESGYPYLVAATAWALARDRTRCLANLYRAVDMGWLTSMGQLQDFWPELFADPSLPERVPEWGEFFARLRTGG